MVYGFAAVLATALLATGIRWRHLRRALLRGRVAAHLDQAAALREMRALETRIREEQNRVAVLAAAEDVIDRALRAITTEQQQERGGGDV